MGRVRLYAGRGTWRLEALWHSIGSATAGGAPLTVWRLPSAQSCSCARTTCTLRTANRPEGRTAGDARASAKYSVTTEEVGVAALGKSGACETAVTVVTAVTEGQEAVRGSNAKPSYAKHVA